jgi:2-polyprenyl-3-methyl-5-hydroxy-6-metoxy-1,4-benzoquinol methylase
MNLSRRSDLPELMDDPALPRADYDRCLHDLAAVNRVTLTHRPTLHWLDRATQTLPADRVVSILDIACGEGDLLRAIHRRAVRRGLAVRLEGIDLNPRSAIAAAAQTPPGSGIAWRTGDVFGYSPDPSPDFIVTS